MSVSFQRSSRCSTGGCVALGYSPRALYIRDTVSGDVVEVRGASARATLVAYLKRSPLSQRAE
ncbi:hypothetical protein [Actinokineospora enzanensis]|uniref:hypothetical protein n=1 Tax=Actinokineospora enzanensis TaxID=155975 RepID=UPI00036D0670|nr:hypothetical protein [Actinokineospora enzanensis]